MSLLVRFAKVARPRDLLPKEKALRPVLPSMYIQEPAMVSPALSGSAEW